MVKLRVPVPEAVETPPREDGAVKTTVGKSSASAGVSATN